MPYGPYKRYSQLPVSGKRMQRFLQCRLGCHDLPIAAGHWAASHVVRADRLCSCCGAGALGDEQHLMFECALVPLRQPYADLCTGDVDSIRAFLGSHTGL